MFICIWCEDLKRGIGNKNQLPWKIPSEMALFKIITKNSIIVMGRNNFLSLNQKPLPQRKNIVISRSLASYHNKQLQICSLSTFCQTYKNYLTAIYVIGGKQLYDFFIPYSHFLLVSKLKQTYPCDLFMDNSFDNFKIIKKSFFNQFTFFVYQNQKRLQLI